MSDSSKPVDSSGQTSAEKIAAAQRRLAKTRALKAQEVSFKYSPTSSTVRAFDKLGGELGYMTLNPANKFGDREIKMIHVSDTARGKGVAGGLFTEAQRLKLKPIHSTNRSEMGDAFAKSTGTYVPEKASPTRIERSKEGRGIYTERRAENKAYGRNLAKQKAVEKQLSRLASSVKANSAVASNPLKLPADFGAPKPVTATRVAPGGVGLPRVPGSIPGVVAPPAWMAGGAGVLNFLPMLMQAGNIATGNDPDLKRQLAVLRQPQ